MHFNKRENDVFITPVILAHLKALNTGKTAKYLRDTARTLTPSFITCQYFVLANPSPEELKNLASF